MVSHATMWFGGVRYFNGVSRVVFVEWIVRWCNGHDVGYQLQLNVWSPAM